MAPSLGWASSKGGEDLLDDACGLVQLLLADHQRRRQADDVPAGAGSQIDEVAAHQPHRRCSQDLPPLPRPASGPHAPAAVCGSSSC